MDKLNDSSCVSGSSDNLGATQTKIWPFVNGNEKTLFSSASEMITP